MVDICGCYLALKHSALSSVGILCAPLPLPDELPLGWVVVNEEGGQDIMVQIPSVLPTTLYQYLYIV